MTHEVPFAITLVAVLGIASQWIAWRLRLPAIVVLAAAGLAVGPGLGWLDPSATFGELLRPMVGFAVAVILFEGGLRLKITELSHAAGGVRRLCTVGLVFSFALGTLAARWLAGLSWPVALVLGAILVVTGPTVIMPLLRQVRLERRTASLLKWEGIVNDPIGALLAVLVFEMHGRPDYEGLDWVQGLLFAVVGGGLLGAAGGLLLTRAFRHGKVPEYLKAPTLLAAVLLVFTGADLLQEEAGLLATTVMGVVVGNSGIASLADLTRFKDSLVVLLVSGVFVLLTADMEVGLLTRLDVPAAVFLLALLFVVRPASVLLATVGSDVSRAERLLLAWIAPRGVVAAAVAGVFGPALVDAGYEDGALLLPLVFGVVLSTVVLHGFTIGWVSRRLGLAGARQGLLVVGATRWTHELARTLVDLGVPVTIADTTWSALRRSRLAGIPVHYGEVLSEDAEETLPLNTFSAVLAASANDAYNALVCVHFGPEIGRDRVYQLARMDVDIEDLKAVTVTMRGRVAMADNAHHERLLSLHWQGWRFQKTTITETYGFEDWRRDNGSRALVVLILHENGSFDLNGANFELDPGRGDILVSWTPPREDERPRARAGRRIAGGGMTAPIRMGLADPAYDM